jgi:hypothetical protein
VALISVLRTSQPLTKNQLQKLFLNLCSHSQTRRSILQMLLSLIRAQAAEQEQQQQQQQAAAGAGSSSAAAAAAAAAAASSPAAQDMEVSTGGAPGAEQQQEGQQQGGRTSICAVLDTMDEEGEQQPGVPGAQAAAGGAGGAAGSSGGAAAAQQQQQAGGGSQAVLSRRVLEMTTYLARASKQVADLLLLLPVPADTPVTRPPRPADLHGKRVPEPEQPEAGLPRAVEVLLQVGRRRPAPCPAGRCQLQTAGRWLQALLSL